MGKVTYFFFLYTGRKEDEVHNGNTMYMFMLGAALGIGAVVIVMFFLQYRGPSPMISVNGFINWILFNVPPDLIFHWYIYEILRLYSVYYHVGWNGKKPTPIHINIKIGDSTSRIKEFSSIPISQNFLCVKLLFRTSFKNVLESYRRNKIIYFIKAELIYYIH